MSLFIDSHCFADAYRELLDALVNRPDFVCRPRGMEVKELIAPTIRITDPTDRLLKSDARSTPIKYMSGEFLWYFSGRHDPEFITKYSAFWNQIKNPKPVVGVDVHEGKVNSSYGRLSFSSVWSDASWEGRGITQWEWAIRSIARDIDTRQAIVHINRPSHQVDWIKDFPCTMHFQFLVRGNALHMVVGMRSNDVVKGTTFDIPMFGFFQETMLHHLRSAHELIPSAPKELRSLTLGHLTLTANSSHLYERDYETARMMLDGGISGEGSEPLYEPPFYWASDDDGTWRAVLGDHFSVLYAKADKGLAVHPAQGKLSGIYKRMYESI
jgi:thymidylate synthase